MQSFSEKVLNTHNDTLGKHLKAAIDIATGDVLLQEKPLLIVPHWECERMKCANCLKDSFVMCTKCNFFPLCIDCTSHNDFDCEFLRIATETISKNLLVKNYAIYAALKALLLLENEQTSKQFEELFKFDAHGDQHQASIMDDDMWQEYQRNIAKPLLDSGIMAYFKRIQSRNNGKIVDEEYLKQLIYCIDTNAFEVMACSNGNKADGTDEDSLKGVYAYGTQLPHSCVPNTVMSFDNKFNLIIYAAVDIRSGEVIYNSYANPLMGTSQRQLHLHITRHITCNCPRCLDPTELGTHMSSLKCQKCEDGYMISHTNCWKCNKCDDLLESAEVNKLIASASEDMMNADGDLRSFEELLAKYRTLLHSNHFLLIDLRQNIITLLRALLMNSNMFNNDNGPSKKVLQRQLQLSEEILPIIRAVLPGLSKLYAIASYDYLLAFVELTEMQFKDEDISLDVYQSKLRKAFDIVNQALDMLAFEPPNSQESQLVEYIGLERKRIEMNLKQCVDQA